ncbi:nuclear distribution protein nudE-like 1 [Clytia hemisphaerica]|uniref:NUDE domain-containing protein n=1 Tax=Clytia hemisphaerica TaxID=252671 RepID=A0A7M5VCZ6_9CNID
MVTDISEMEQQYFDDPKEEANYWKQIAEEYIQKLQDVKDEFDDFQEGSRELEAELEAQLEQYEKRVKELVNTRSTLEEENEMLKEKLETTQRESYIQITTLQDENTQIRTVKDEMTKYIREIEQTNDDLERAKRATICSLEEFDSRLNSAIERNAFLENELEEKEELIITVQRLKDEARDLKADLALSSRTRHPSLSEQSSKSSSFNESPTKPPLDATTTTTPKSSETTREIVNNTSNHQITNTPKKNHETMEAEKNKTNALHNSTTPPSRIQQSNPMTPSARISALNIVSDLLRKVGALESKLASCRNFVQDHPRNGKTIHGVSPLTDSPKSRSKSTTGGNKGSNNISGLVKVNV